MLRFKSLALLVVLLLPVFAVASTPTDKERGDLRGPVKSVRTESAAYSGGGAAGCSENQRELESVSEYNQDGNLALFTDYNSDGSVHRRDDFLRNPSGILVQQSSYDAKGNLFEKQSFDAVNGGRLMMSSLLRADGSADWTTTYKYGDDGQPIGSLTVDSNGGLIGGQALNAGGKATEEVQYKDGVLLSKRVMKYDADGKVIESTHYAADGSLLDEPKEPARSVYKYGPSGLLSEQTGYTASSSVLWKQLYSYDDHENISGISSFRDGNTLISKRTFSYQYDSRGNWIKQSVSEDFANVCSQPMQVRYRTIKYY